MNKKNIKFSDIKKILNYELEIFEEQDDRNDRRKIVPKEKAIWRILERINSEYEEQLKVYSAVSNEMFNSDNFTYKPICNNLRNLGYEILRK